MKKSNKETYDKVLGNLQDQLVNAEDLGQWSKPWRDSAAHGIPNNPITGNHYNGVNILALWASQNIQGFDRPEWAGFNQWRQKGGHIRRGEKGTPVLIWRVSEKDKVDRETGQVVIDQETGRPEIETVVFATHKAVFNILQQEGYPIPEEEPPRDTVEELDSWFRDTGARVIHGGNRAYYSPSLDEIHLPKPEQFQDDKEASALDHYYSTLGHETVHWTGAEDRLNRKIRNIFGSSDYAYEELCAEIGSAFLDALHGLPVLERKDHAQYLASWQRAIRDKAKNLILAAREAQRAVDYLEKIVEERRKIDV